MDEDFSIENHGSLFLVRPHNTAAEKWLNDNVGGDVSWLGSALAVEPRYVDELLHGILDAGFTTH